MVSIHSSLYTKKSGGKMTRFKGHSAHADQNAAALRADHPAIVSGRSLFQKSVIDAGKSPRLMISGVNSPKIGSRIVKGPWAGMPIFTFSLEERATCPSSCHLWRECYGNAMPLARRHRDDGTLLDRLEAELRIKQKEHGRFAVRLHVLGDFPSEKYTIGWANWLDDFPGLHVWGYTAHPPWEGVIGPMIRAMNAIHPSRCVIRFSVKPGNLSSQMEEATTIWQRPEGNVVPEGQVCPVSTGKSDACGTCGLCWSQEMRATRIVFIGHGMNARGKAPTVVVSPA